MAVKIMARCLMFHPAILLRIFVRNGKCVSIDVSDDPLLRNGSRCIITFAAGRLGGTATHRPIGCCFLP